MWCHKHWGSGIKLTLHGLAWISLACTHFMSHLKSTKIAIFYFRNLMSTDFFLLSMGALAKYWSGIKHQIYDTAWSNSKLVPHRARFQYIADQGLSQWTNEGRLDACNMCSIRPTPWAYIGMKWPTSGEWHAIQDLESTLLRTCRHNDNLKH